MVLMKAGIDFSELSRMSNNLKAPAKEVQQACRSVQKSDFDKIIGANSGERAKQWQNVKRAFYQNCDAATVAVVSPNPDPQIIGKLNPSWSTETAARVKANASAAAGGKRRRRNKTKMNRKNRSRKTRRNRN
jgi:hypothetical protein